MPGLTDINWQEPVCDDAVRGLAPSCETMKPLVSTLLGLPG
jgi:hypothetical protein